MKLLLYALLLMPLSAADLSLLSDAELREGVSKSDLSAKVEFAWRQLNGQSQPLDQAFVLKTFTEGSNAGIARAHTGLADCHANGVGMRRDNTKVEALLQKAIQQGDAEAHLRLGWYYYFGTIFGFDRASGKELIGKAVDLGLVDAKIAAARVTIMESSDEATRTDAIDLMKQLANEVGSSQAAFALGNYYHGRIDEQMKPNPKLAMQYYMMAVEKNHVAAMVAMGDLAVGKNEWQASNPARLEGAKWYRKAIALNSRAAKRKLAEMQIRDTVVRSDGEDWYQLLLDADWAGDSWATLKLADINYHAPGYTFRDLDWKESATFYEKWLAENPNDSYTRYGLINKLLEIYFEGGLGLERDFNKCLEIAEPYLDSNSYASLYAGRILLHPDAPLGKTREHFIRGYACLLKSRELWKSLNHRLYWLSDEGLFVLRSRHGMTREEVARAEKMVAQGFPNSETPLLP